jgi:GT2 family glycosyltransferase
MASSENRLPLISVVVPSYNQGHFLPETFESIFRQNYPRLEVVVIDGGSTDASVDVIRRHAARIKFWRSERDGGQSAAINEGMRHCSGDLVAWLNSDDLYWDDCLFTVGKAYARFPGRGLYFGNGLRYDQESRVYTPFNRRHVAMDREALTRGADFLLQPSTFFLRAAWQRVGGLDEQLRFCMDWDIFIRIARQYPCVGINEFLGVSREYEETKTRSGKMERAFEILRMIRRHTSLEITPGGMLYLLETVAGMGEAEGVTEGLRDQLKVAFSEVVKGLCARHGRGLWFPACGDAGDETYLPVATPGLAASAEESLPSISVVITGGDQTELVDATRESIRAQGYPAVEIVTAGAGATAAAEGLHRACGDVLVWAEAGDLIADGALQAAGRLFAEDSELGLVAGNALHVDEHGELFLADHGLFDSGFWVGTLPPLRVPTDFHFEFYKVARPAVYFRRKLLEHCGGPDASLRHGFADVDLFRRLAASGRPFKLQRTLALVRTPAATYLADRRKMLADLYLLERPHWPRPFGRGYRQVVRRFVGNYMRWKFLGESHRKMYWVAAGLAALSVVTGVGNPMRWWPERDIVVAPRATRRPTAVEPVAA